MVKVSIVVPVYNVGPYLARCLDSLVSQTLADIEIICIDDKSTDNSLGILREYETKDNRIRVIALDKNSGVATARNVGIDAAVGEYLGFVDSDDYVDPDFYEKLYDAAKRDDADMARGNCKITDYSGNERIDDTEIKNVESRGKWLFDWQWWCAIYKSDMLDQNHIRFPIDIISGQDTVFLINCIGKSNRIATQLTTFYHYIRREGSLDEKIMPPNKIASRIKAYSAITDFLNICPDIDKRNYIRLYINFIICTFKHSSRNTSRACKAAIANAVIEIYIKCKYKPDIAKGLKTLGTNAVEHIQSHDVDGLVRHFQELRPQVAAKSIPLSVPKTNKYKLFIFGCLPIIQLHKSENTTLLRFCGIELLKIKRGRHSIRLAVLYIPIIKVKSK